MALQFFLCFDFNSCFYQNLDHYLSSHLAKVRGHYVSALAFGRGKGGVVVNFGVLQD